MKRLPIFAIFLCFISGAYAQLTQSQKVTDFLSLAALYDRHYAPYEWKRDNYGFDLLNIKPWLDQVNASKDDLAFYDICVRYVASLRDSHDEFILPADFEAFLPILVDIYDGKVLIDDIDPTLSPKTYPFQIGDELVSVDGKSMEDWIKELEPYTVNGSANPVSRRRLAAAMAIDRYQGWYTYAQNVGESAKVEVRRKNGNLETYTLTWEKFGTPLVSDGLLPSPISSSAARATSQTTEDRGFNGTIRQRRSRILNNPWGLWAGARAVAPKEAVPEYMASLTKLQEMRYMPPAVPVAGSIAPFGDFFPKFDPPPGFRLRLGGRSTDLFLSATFPVGNLNIGFIRIPDMSPSNQTTALQQYQTEIAFFQANTDGLIIDVMGNGGGSICYTNTLTRFLVPTPFRTLGFSLRATQSWLLGFSSALSNAQFTNAPGWVQDLYAFYIKQIQLSLSENRGLTGPLPLCGTSFDNIPPATDTSGRNLAYTKPIVVLTDNFTLSAGELFAATLQDANRVTVYGTRTDGGGGNVVGYDVPSYSEGFVRVTESLAVRAKPISTPGFPDAPFIENIGVYPDVTADYMTIDNLEHGGATFVAGFSTVMSNLIKLGHP
jgi:hypothetical protein